MGKTGVFDAEELGKGRISRRGGMRTWADEMRAESGLVILPDSELEDILSGGKWKVLKPCLSVADFFGACRFQ